MYKFTQELNFDPDAQIRRFLQKVPVDYPIYKGGTSAVEKLFATDEVTVPLSVVIDSNGNVQQLIRKSTRPQFGSHGNRSGSFRLFVRASVQPTMGNRSARVTCPPPIFIDFNHTQPYFGPQNDFAVFQTITSERMNPVLWPGFPRRLLSALKALCCLAHSDRTMRAPEIAQRIGVSTPETGKVMQLLVWGGFVTSRRGSKGGLQLANAPNQFTAGEVVRFF